MNYVTLVFCLVIGAACLWASLKMVRWVLKVKNWNRTSVVIRSKELFIHPRYSTTRTPYGIRAEYTYQVNGVGYSGHTVYLAELAGGQVNHMKKDAEKQLAKLDTVTLVFVDPENPQRSVLFCRGIGLYVFILLCGLGCLLAGMVQFLLMI